MEAKRAKEGASGGDPYLCPLHLFSKVHGGGVTRAESGLSIPPGIPHIGGEHEGNFQEDTLDRISPIKMEWAPFGAKKIPPALTPPVSM